MTPLPSLVRNWLGDDEVVHECRNCGTTVDADDSTCLACGASDIVTHEVD
jgi:rubrerythrin